MSTASTGDRASGDRVAGGNRVQMALLTGVGLLLAADLFVRLEPPAAQAEVAVQPERRSRDVPTLINPATQRAAMVEQLKELNRSIGQLERRLDGRLRVEVTNFPKVEPSGD